MKMMMMMIDDDDDDDNMYFILKILVYFINPSMISQNAPLILE